MEEPSDDISALFPLFLSSKTQEIFECRMDEDITADKPYKLIQKEAILNDIKARAAISDFHPVKQIVIDYPEKELLLVYDADFQFGQNFYLVITEEKKCLLLNPPLPEGAEEEEGLEEEEEEEVAFTYVPPEPKEWVPFGSDREIEAERVTDTRPRIKYSFSRLRREFGTAVHFSDRSAEDSKESCVNCLPYEDKNFTLRAQQLDKYVQAVSLLVDSSSQTKWPFPQNVAIQYAPQELEEDESKEILQDKKLGKFVQNTLPRFELALQQNEMLDLYMNDWKNLGSGDAQIGKKADSHMKEFQSFTDLHYSKDRSISCIEWHPIIRGILAVSCCHQKPFDERVCMPARFIVNPSLIMIWSFSDPIHPLLMLEAPDDIICFRFNPTDPTIIVGGCINGQLILWDITEHQERLHIQRTPAKSEKNPLTAAGALNVPEKNVTSPKVRHCALSSIEHAHKNPVTEIEWIPKHIEVTKTGAIKGTGDKCVQIVSCSSDNSILFWDIKATAGQNKKLASSVGLMSNAQKFQHLDLVWKPFLRLHIPKTDSTRSGAFAPTKFSLYQCHEKVASKGHAVSNQELGKSSAIEIDHNMYTSRFFVGTEDGQLAYADWKASFDTETGRITCSAPSYVISIHNGPVLSVVRSPFFRNLLLTVGTWSFAVWKEGLTTPILNPISRTHHFTYGCWSPSRPAVFFLAKDDGNIEVWDLLDRTHEPILSQNISPASLTYIAPYHISTSQQLLAISDSIGTLHIFDLPWSLRQAPPKEALAVQNYVEREVSRMYARTEKLEEREQQAIVAAEAAPAVGTAETTKDVDISDQETEQRMKVAYDNYLRMEKEWLIQLGLVEESKEIEDLY